MKTSSEKEKKLNLALSKLKNLNHANPRLTNTLQNLGDQKNQLEIEKKEIEKKYENLAQNYKQLKQKLDKINKHKTTEQNKEIESITSRWQADSISDSWLSKNVRPLVLVWCICIFSLAGILDSVESIPFHINSTWNDTFEKVMMAVVLAYFGARTTEKATSIYKQK